MQGLKGKEEKLDFYMDGDRKPRRGFAEGLNIIRAAKGEYLGG